VCTFALSEHACYHASLLCEGALLAKQGGNRRMPDADDRTPAPRPQVPHLIRSPSSPSPLLGHFYSVHVNSRNQSNSMKTKAGPNFYFEHLDTLGITNSPANPLLSQEFGAPALPYSSQACRLSTLPISSPTPSAHSAYPSAAFPPSLPAAPPLTFSISNRQFLGRLETSATRTKQTPAASSNRHFWGPISPNSRVEFISQS
jgi:hypothetical protein